MSRKFLIISLLLCLMLDSAGGALAESAAEETTKLKPSDTSDALKKSVPLDSEKVNDTTKPIHESTGEAEPAPAANSSTADSTTVIPVVQSTEPPLLKEKLKKELDQIHKEEVAQARKLIVTMDSMAPFNELIKKCKSQRFPSLIYNSLGADYYIRAIATDKYQDAIKYLEWLLQAMKLYKDVPGISCYIKTQNLYLAYLYSLSGDYEKANLYCKQYFLSVPEANRERARVKAMFKSSGFEDQANSFVATVTSKIKNFPQGPLSSKPEASICVVQARISYNKSDYKEAAKFLDQAKANGLELNKTTQKSDVHKTGSSASKK